MIAMRLHRRAMDWKNIAMSREPARLGRVGMFHVTIVQHLNLDPAQKGHTGRADRRAPDEDARVSATAQMPPLGLHDEVLILLLRAHGSCRFAGAGDHPILDAPGLRRAICIHPAGQAVWLKHWHKTILRMKTDGGENAEKKWLHGKWQIGWHGKRRDTNAGSRRAITKSFSRSGNARRACHFQSGD